MSGPSNPDIFTNHVICAKATNVLQYVLVSIGYTNFVSFVMLKTLGFCHTSSQGGNTKANCHYGVEHVVHVHGL
jgi:hypothetical protein